MKHRTLKLLSLGVILAVALVMGSTALGQIAATDHYLVEYMAEIADHPGYLVRDRDGYLAVYYKGSGYPVFLSDIPTSTLRGQDREDVKRGISIATRRELVELLEDFGS